MKKRTGIALLFLLTALIFSGCGMRTVEQMYCVPKRSQSYDHVQKAMDMAMVGLEYAAPVSGENQQTVQLADLDGDGMDEYVLFARNPSQIPLNVLIFDTDTDGKCYLLEVLELQGSAFEKVEYVQMDGMPGVELVIGRQLSDQLQGNVCIYTFASGRAEKLLSVNYAHFLTCDLSRDGKSELLLITSGESGQPGEFRGVAVTYQYGKGEMARSMEVRISASASSVERIVEGSLEDGAPAVFVSSTVDDTAITTDVLCMDQGKLKNLMKPDTSVQALRNYYVYAADMDGDGITELPSLIPMRIAQSNGLPESRYLICWYSLDRKGERTDKLYTYHDYGGGWYLQLDPDWATQISAEKEANTYTFYLWNEEGTRAKPLFAIYVFTGSSRDQEAGSDGRFPLLRKEGIAYGALIYEEGAARGVTEAYLKDSFHLIRQDWKTGET